MQADLRTGSLCGSKRGLDCLPLSLCEPSSKKASTSSSKSAAGSVAADGATCAEVALTCLAFSKAFLARLTSTSAVERQSAISQISFLHGIDSQDEVLFPARVRVCAHTL
jgi:hypothetical protein